MTNKSVAYLSKTYVRYLYNSYLPFCHVAETFLQNKTAVMRLRHQRQREGDVSVGSQVLPLRYIKHCTAGFHHLSAHTNIHNIMRR